MKPLFDHTSMSEETYELVVKPERVMKGKRMAKIDDVFMDKIVAVAIQLIVSVPTHAGGGYARRAMINRNLIDELNGLLIAAGVDMREERRKARSK